MFRKIFVAAFLAVSIMFVGNYASAQDFWVFTDEDGIEYYVIDETTVNKTQYRDNRQFIVDVKLVRNSAADIKTFSFRENDGIIFYGVDGNEKGFTKKGTAAYSIWEHGLKYLGIDYKVRYD